MSYWCKELYVFQRLFINHIICLKSLSFCIEALIPFFWISTIRDDADFALERATYNCPWLKTRSRWKRPTWSNVCPCDLLMVIAKAGIIGNCFRRSLKGTMRLSVDVKVNLGIRTSLFWNRPVNIRACRMLWPHCVNFSLVPLQSPALIFRFLISITIAPTLRMRRCGGRPDMFKLLRNSMGYCSSSSSPAASAIESALV